MDVEDKKNETIIPSSGIHHALVDRAIPHPRSHGISVYPLFQLSPPLPRHNRYLDCLRSGTRLHRSKEGPLEQTSFWGKYLMIMSAYTAQMILILISVLLLDSARVLKYYGGDAGGSVGLLYFPSIVIYWFTGAALGILGEAFHWIRKHIQPPASPRTRSPERRKET